MYRSLDDKGITGTAEQLRARITVRFRDSSLSKVAAELVELSRAATVRATSIIAPNTTLRAGVYFGSGVLLFISLVVLVRFSPDFTAFSFAQFVEILDALINIAVLIGGAIFSLVTFEGREQRSRAVAALHELRAMAHVIDMHQLAKQPGHVDDAIHPDVEAMSPPDLTAYLSWCTELLSLVGKLGAYYVQDLNDEVSLDEANELEDLTTGLSQKIWQKIMIVHQARGMA
ncbi:MAG: hypothetical protein SGI88_11805 [Candidatus Hydrogenedentes bacterium]|nr:hypothetical protein [Candidatus Hydrogenedentota bacterium]